MPGVGAVVLGTLAALVAVAPARAQTGDVIEHGRSLYAESCAFCHGIDGDGQAGIGPPGVRGGGPPLRGVGARSADFYLTTGYMPLDEPGQTPQRRRPRYTPGEIAALTAYIASLGGGPEIPQVDPAQGDLAVGMRAFTEHCAGCHQIVAEGGLVLDGVAPHLAPSTPTQIAEAVRIGPYLMPAFSEQQIDERTLASIVRYVEYAKRPRDEGGWGIGHIGPVPEGFIAWLVAAVVLVGVARIIGSRSA